MSLIYKKSLDRKWTGHEYEKKAEILLKNYKYSRGQLKTEVDIFIALLPPYLQDFADFRYRKSMTMEKVAELIGYSIRNTYKLRKKLLQKWIIYLGGDQPVGPVQK